MKIRKPQVNINNVPDFKDEFGNWVRSWVENLPDKQIQRVTRAGMLWNSINTRCKPNGPKQKRTPSYVGVNNRFKSFNIFCEWCQTQVGYLNLDTNGRYWQLDKDILMPESMEYSETTCCFVPTRINTLFTYRSENRGDQTSPVGVYFNTRKQRYICRTIVNGENKVIYMGKDPIEGHRMWQKNKYETIIALAKDYIGLSGVVRKGMISHANLIKDDYDNNRITSRVVYNESVL